MGKENDIKKAERINRNCQGVKNSNKGEYRGLPIFAYPGLHEFAARKIYETFPKGGEILDIGAGSGAFSERLLDMGFHVTATDILSDGFKLKDKIPFIEADLNQSLPQGLMYEFDGIVSLEIIEHLENPRKFLRDCHNMLRPGGLLILSTPNIDSPVSKALFARYGTFSWFHDESYETSGHIMPISHWLLKKMVCEINFQIDWIGTYGNPYESVGILCKTFSKFMEYIKNDEIYLNGEILIAILRKITP